MKTSYPAIRRWLLTLAGALLLSPLAFAGGGGEPATAPDLVTYTIVSDHVGSTFDEPHYQELERFTGVHLEPRLIPEDEISTQYGLMAAAGDLPDLAARLTGDLSLKFGLDGLLMGLKGLEEFRPNFVSALDEYQFDFATFVSNFGNEDGDYFVSPGLRGWAKNYKDVFIYRSDIFEKENLDVPQTSDELLETMRTLKQRYPNSTPFMQFRHWFRPYYIMFGVYDYPQGEEYYHQPAYQDALRYLATMYTEGLMDQEWPTRDSGAVVKAWNEEATVFFEGSHGYSFLGNASALIGVTKEENAAASTDPFGAAGKLAMEKLYTRFGFFGIPTHGSARRATPPASNVSAFGIGMNAEIEFPEVAAKWLDFLYSEYGAAWTHLRSPEGVNWVSTSGFTGAIEWPTFGNATVERRIATQAEKDASYDTYARELRLFGLFDGAFPTLPAIMEHTGSLPVRRMDVFDLDASQIERQATLQAQLDPVVQEWEQRFILGRADVDGDWDDYMTALSRAGLDDLLTLRGQTLTRRPSGLIEPVPGKTGMSIMAP